MTFSLPVEKIILTPQPIRGGGRGAVLLLCFSSPYTQNILGNPYLNILNLLKLFVVDTPVIFVVEFSFILF